LNFSDHDFVTNITMSSYHANQTTIPTYETVSVEEWADAECSNLEARETIRHLKEIVIPNLQERQALQNDYWSKRWNEAQTELEKHKKNAAIDMEFMDNIQASYQEKNELLEEAEQTAYCLRGRNQLLENGVTRSRGARRDTNFYKKENKRLKAQIVEAQSWREFLGMGCYEHGVRHDEEYQKRIIVQDELKEMEEKYELVRQNNGRDDKEGDTSTDRIQNYQEEMMSLRKTLHEVSCDKAVAEKLANDLNNRLENANNAMDGIKQQFHAGRLWCCLEPLLEKDVNKEWKRAYYELIVKYQTALDGLPLDNYVHIYPGEQDVDGDTESEDNIVEVPPRAGVGWDSENRPNYVSNNENIV